MADVIFIAGLGDTTGYIEKATKDWLRKYGLTTAVFAVGWNDPLETYEAKYQALAKLFNKDGTTAVVGISAGGSLAMNSLRRYPKQVACAVSICGTARLRPQDQDNKRLAEAPLLRRSIEECQEHIDRQKQIMTLRPLHDRIVPVQNVPIMGAINHRMWVVGHVLGIYWALNRKTELLVDFIKQQTGK